MDVVSFQIDLFIIGVLYSSFCSLNYLFPQESDINENIFLSYLQFARHCSRHISRLNKELLLL